jgi:hypothetical protein
MIKEYAQSLKNILHATKWINASLLCYVVFFPSTSTSHTVQEFLYRFNIFQNPQNSQVTYLTQIF